MTRHDEPSKAAKTQRRGTLSSAKMGRISRHGGSAAAVNETGFAQLIRERDEALQQQAATSEVLSIIRRSPADAQPVFDAIVQSAARLCGAIFSILYLYNDNRMRIAATSNFNPEATGRIQEIQQLKRPERSHLAGRAILDRAIVHVHDVLADPEYSRELALAGGWRAVLSVPLLRDGKPVGALSLGESEPTLFSERQVQLLQTFAEQALIAIENVRLFEAEQQRTRELSESLDQQTATSEVLRVISSSPGELEPVFQTILSNATRLCEAKFGTLYRYDGGTFYPVTFHKVPPSFADFLRQRGSFVPPPGTPLDRLLRTRDVVRTADDSAEETPSPSALLAGAKSHVVVPMFKDGELTGAIVIYRMEVRPFTDKQVELVTNFAAQAVIAIENTRLLNELRESLEQQTATSEVLKIISSSPSDLKPVFHSMLENSVRICEAKFGQMFLCEGDKVRAVATLDVPAALVQEDERRGAFQPSAEGGLARAIRTKKVLHIDDLMSEQPSLPVVKLGGARSYIAVPMLKESDVVGVIVIYRQEVRPFTGKQVDLVKNFAAQAVIAIENARLLNELRQRTGDLSESLEQQTATSEVLKVISSSPGDLEPVFQAILANATRICDAKFGVLFRYENGMFRAAATLNAPQAFVEFHRERGSFKPPAGTPLDRLLKAGGAIYSADEATNPGAPARLGGARSLVTVPMRKDGQLIGAIIIYRQEVRPFTDKQIELLTNFAAQAVIAIENTRLLNELRESLQQQTATSEVLQTISSSQGDLQPVFNAMLGNATRICEAKFGVLFLYEGDAFRVIALHGAPPAYAEERRRDPRIGIPHGTAMARMVETRQTVQIADIQSEPAYFNDPQRRAGLIGSADARTLIMVPMLKEEELIGAISIYRQEVRAFTDKQIELVTNFASQAVIAIENSRLLNELRQRTHDLTQSLEDLRATQDRLVQTQKLALLGQLTAGIAHEIKNPLNFVNNFSGISAELIDELQVTLKGIPLDDKARAEIEELADTLKGNFDKVVHHGRRADAIVKNMLQHSREGSGEHRVIDVNALVEESLNLAWHGARAETKGFEIKLKQSFDPSAGEADVFPQDIRRALLNVISNGFYAATKRRGETDGADYEPTLTASTKNLGDRVEIRIGDNGSGMTPEVKEKMFNPFFTTKPTGEGTGLGLSISHDIIVKQHGGSIEVDTQPGEFTDIRVILPRVAVFV